MDENMLFELIKSLDRTEKRGFKIHLSKYETKKGTNSLLLFDAISKMDVYDEENLLKALGKGKLIRNLEYEKQCLLDTILHFITVFSKTSISSQLYSMLKEVEALVRKNHLDLAFKILDKGVELSESNNEYVIAYLFLDRKLELVHLTKFKKDKQVELLAQYKSKFNQLKVFHHEFIGVMNIK